MVPRSAAVACILLGGALLQGCPPPAPPPAEGHELLNVEAGTVTLAGSKVYGEWKVIRDGTGIETRGSGGACLVQLAEDLGGPKTCATADLPGAIAGKTGWFGYNGPDGQCWMKPGKDPRACNRTPDYLPNGPRRWEVSPNAYRSNLDFLPLTAPPGTTTHWRVVACLNGYDDTTKRDSIDCGLLGPNRREVWGDVVAITVPPPVPLPDLSTIKQLRTGASPPAPNPAKGAGGVSVNSH